MTNPDDDFLVSMGWESCWVTPEAAEALCDEGFCEYSLFQDAESGNIVDGLALCPGTTPDDVWHWIKVNGKGFPTYLEEDE